MHEERDPRKQIFALNSRTSRPDLHRLCKYDDLFPRDKVEFAVEGAGTKASDMHELFKER